MSELQNILNASEKRRADGKLRWESQDYDECMLCDAHGADKRSLFMSCFYDLQEAIPEFLDLSGIDGEIGKRGWYLRICKSCRARLLGHIRAWGNECKALRDIPKDHDGYLVGDWIEGKIPVRVDGATTYMTPYEYKQHTRGERGDGSRRATRLTE